MLDEITEAISLHCEYIILADVLNFVEKNR